MWRRKHNHRRRCWLFALSSRHAPGASRPSSRFSPRSSVRPACLPHMCSLRFSSARPLPRIAWLPAPSTSGTGRNNRRRRRMASVVMTACLPRGDERSGSIVPRSFLDRFHPHRLIQSARPRLLSSSHRPISSTGRGILFPFRLTPSRRLFSACLLGLVPPSSAGGCEDLCHGLRRRACGLFACVLVSRAALSLPLVRSLLYALRRSCRSFLPGASLGVLWAFLTAILSALAFLKTCP